MPASLMQTTQGFTSSFLSITSNATVMNAMSAPKKEIKSCVTKSMLHNLTTCLISMTWLRLEGAYFVPERKDLG